MEFATTDVIKAKLQLVRTSTAFQEHEKVHEGKAELNVLDTEVAELAAREQDEQESTSLEATLKQPVQSVTEKVEVSNDKPERRKVFFAQCTCGQTFELEGEKTRPAGPTFVEETNEYGLAVKDEQQQPLYKAESPTGDLYN